jgi:hypothetical protein
VQGQITSNETEYTNEEIKEILEHHKKNNCCGCPLRSSEKSCGSTIAHLSLKYIEQLERDKEILKEDKSLALDEIIRVLRVSEQQKIDIEQTAYNQFVDVLLTSVKPVGYPVGNDELGQVWHISFNDIVNTLKRLGVDVKK